jgi:putative transposase
VHPNRKSIRLPTYDYSSPGMYFVTICTHQREPTLGAIDAGYMIPNDAGKFVEQIWHALPIRFPNLKTDKFILMPNHVHAILFLESPQSNPGAASGAPTTATSLTRASIALQSGSELTGALTRHPSLAAVVRAFKSQSATGVNKIRMTRSDPVWQRNYFEHIIRTPQSLDDLRRYIQENPARWHSDEENPLRVNNTLAGPILS